MFTAVADAAGAKASVQIELDLSERRAVMVLAKGDDNMLQESGRLRDLLGERHARLVTMVPDVRALNKEFATPQRTRMMEGGIGLVALRNATIHRNAKLLRKRTLKGLSSDGRLLVQADGQMKMVGPQLLGRLRLDQPTAMVKHCHQRG